eukprot:TRINITY_DN55794_c0_g1_i1.p1 TRINITY_DN55794_c0_g1~~TRINITY_DN55794_c0_g1_i1.p1  ORF type:complete len:374 (-),score=60.43 TRINITY_DN55794_c0_g1_i1:50-1171(-)
MQTPGTGVGSYYLAGVKNDFPHCAAVSDPTEPRAHNMAEFREEHSDDMIQASLVNKVRICTACGKPCAFTLTNCNSCSASLQGIALSTNDNVFMGFIYGIQGGKFPYKISMRKQTPEFLCFDDPLSLSVCHLNVIPTQTWIPDFRYLFTDPPRGAALLKSMFEIGASVAMDQFWANDDFRRRLLSDSPVPSIDEISELVFAGMNFPPSMYQLHLQFIHPPMTPFHYDQTLMEQHFHHGRFFPLEYLLKALSLGDAAKMDVTEDMKIEVIVEHMKGLGVNYDEYQIALLRRCRRLQEKFSPWKESDFSYYVINGKVFSTDGMVPVPAQDPKALLAADTKLLQNYGRPYGEDGKPTGIYYKYAKSPGDITTFAKQ